MYINDSIDLPLGSAPSLVVDVSRSLAALGGGWRRSPRELKLIAPAFGRKYLWNRYCRLQETYRHDGRRPRRSSYPIPRLPEMPELDRMRAVPYAGSAPNGKPLEAGETIKSPAPIV